MQQSLSLVLIGLVFMIVSCSKTDKTAESYVPGNAKLVVVANVEQILSKLTSNGVSIQDSNDAALDIDTNFKAKSYFWKNMKNAYIDTKKNGVLALVPLQDEGNKSLTFAAIVPITNKDSFEKFVLKKNATTFQDFDGIRLSKLGKGEYLGIKGDYAVYVSNYSGGNNRYYADGISTADYKNQVKSIFGNKYKTSIANHPHYKKNNLDSNDMKIWVNTDYWILENPPVNDMQENLRTFGVRAFKESSLTLLQNFKNGIAVPKHIGM